MNAGYKVFPNANILYARIYNTSGLIRRRSVLIHDIPEFRAKALDCCTDLTAKDSHRSSAEELQEQIKKLDIDASLPVMHRARSFVEEGSWK
eukprot:766518-Hanusia_phi.AAC.9